jgi:hypothetical protein
VALAVRRTALLAFALNPAILAPRAQEEELGRTRMLLSHERLRKLDETAFQQACYKLRLQPNDYEGPLNQRWILLLRRMEDAGRLTELERVVRSEEQRLGLNPR